MNDFSEKGNMGDSIWIVVSSNEDDYESVGTLIITNLETKKRWGMNSIRSYHTCSRKEYFEILKKGEGGDVRLSNNKGWKVHGIGMTRLKMLDNHEFLLRNQRDVPKLKICFCL